mgnify:FL=1
MPYDKLSDDVALEPKRMILNLSVQYGTDDAMLLDWVRKTLRSEAEWADLPIEVDNIVIA